MKIELHTTLYNNPNVRTALEKEFKGVDFIESERNDVAVCATEHSPNTINMLSRVTLLLNTRFHEMILTL